MACGCENMREIFPECDKTRWEVQCSSYIEDADNYYTKKQVDDLIESATTSGSCCITPEEVDEKIASAKTEIEAEIPSLSGYATEQWVLDKNYISGVDLSDYALKSEIPTSNTAFTNDAGYLTEHQQLKTINNESLVGEGNIVISGDCDLTNYYTTAQTVNLVESAVTVVEAEIPSLSGYATEQWVLDKNYITGVDLSNYATEQWVLNKGYVTYAEFIQYISNLQDQINSLREEISGCCSDTGITLTRWITMTGASDYTCSGTTKMTKEKEQSSSDGGNTWTDTGNYRMGDTILEENCIDCGYVPSSAKLYATYNTSETLTINCNGQPLGQLEPQHGGSPYIGNMVTVVIGGCAEEITNNTFGTVASNLRTAVINEGVDYIGQQAFQDLSNLSAVTIPNSVNTISHYAFSGCTSLTNLTIGSGVTTVGDNAFNNCRSMVGSISLPSVTTIGSAAFRGCRSLTSINIGSGITSIGGYMVDGCSGLTGITINAVTPPSINWFTFTNSTCPIYVPSQSVNAYKNGHSNWQHYADRIQPIS